MADINVKLVKSLIGSTKPQIATAYALGLHKIGDESVQPDNAATRGDKCVCKFSRARAFQLRV